MSTEALQRLSTLTVKQLGRLPRLSSSLPAPKPTVYASEVPTLFREPYILSGYRPTGQSWKCYLLSAFQWHNESMNVWTHLLAAPVILLRCWALLEGSGGVSQLLDASALPLVLYVLSSLTYLICSVAAHLLQSHSELAHYSLFFLDYIGVAVYQYGCALGHYFYCSEAGWRDTGIGAVFLPSAALLAWMSCSCCCFAKAHYRRPYPLRRKVCQLIPTSLAYMLDISPVAHRLVFRGDWEQDGALLFHAGQVAFFMLAAIFFSYPFPECCLPGHCDIIGHAHQVFHFFLALCTVCQLEALFRDFVVQREAILDVHGRGLVLGAVASFFVLVFCCLATAVWMRKTVQKQLKNQQS